MNVLFNAVLLLTAATTGVICDVFLQQECDCDFKRPFEWNCDKYYQCENGKLYLKECSDGFHFNPETLICEDSFSCQDEEICLQ